MTNTKLTPREFCARRRSLPFGERRKRKEVVDIRKIGRGLIAVIDTSGDVEPGMIFAVEIEGGIPQIYSYWVHANWVHDDNDIKRALYNRIYTERTLRRMAAQQQIEKIEAITYNEMVRRIRALYPTCWIPDAAMMYGEYGLTYDDATGAVRNPLNLA